MDKKPEQILIQIRKAYEEGRKEAFLEIIKLVNMMSEQETCVGFKFAFRLMKVILKEKSTQDKEDGGE